jgi:hypothetical protein
MAGGDPSLVTMGLLLGACGLVPGVALVLAITNFRIRPHLIPRAEIEAQADAVLEAHPDDPEEWAFLEEQAAWYRSQAVEQGRWRRVRRVLRARRGQRP